MLLLGPANGPVQRVYPLYSTLRSMPLASLLASWAAHLQRWAAEGRLEAAALEALALPEAPAPLRQFSERLLAGGLAELPPVDVLPANAMGGSHAAYAASTGKIYLNQEWWPTADAAAVEAVLTEELGHHLDALLQPADAPGDEGALFAALLRGQSLTASALAELRAEDDQGVIVLDGAVVAVERSGTPIGNHVIHLTGTISEAGEQQVFTFTGTLGDRLMIDSIDVDGSDEGINYRLIAPSGFNTLGNVHHTQDTNSFTLTETGQYQLLIESPNFFESTRTGDYSLNLLRLNHAPILALGTTVTNTLTPGLERDVYRFTGTRGQRLNFDSFLDGNADWFLTGPNNQILVYGSRISGDFTATLPSDGEYYLTFTGYDAGASVSYSFQVNDVSEAPPASPSAFPITQSGSLSGSPTTFTFTAAAGKQLLFDALELSNNVYVRIFDPAGSQIYENWSYADSGNAIVTPRSGTYTVQLSGNGSYDFRLLDLPASATALSFNSTVSETLSPSTGSRIFSFTGAVGQRVLYDSLDPDYQVNTFLIGPSGNQITYPYYSSGDSEMFTLVEAGTYFLIQQGTSTATNDFSFRLLEVPSTPLTFDSVTSTTLAPYGKQLYSFSGTAGQRLAFDSQSSSLSGSWYLRGPNNESISISGASNNLSSDLSVTLPGSGTYVLVLDNNSTSSNAFSFQVVTPTTTSAAYSLSTPVAGTISELGEQDVYTFNGTIGQRLFFDALTNSGNSIYWSLISPSGVTLTNTQSTHSDSGSLITLVETGAFQLIVQGESYYTNAATGAYNFQLIDVTAAPSINLDTTVSGSLTPGLESDFYRFTATAGQTLAFDYLSGTGSSAWWKVWNKNSSYQTYNNIQTEQTFIAPYSGEYFLQIEGYGASALTYSFQLVTPTPSPSTPPTLPLSTATAGSISELGEKDVYTFNGTAGQRLFFDSLVNNNNNLYWSLISPSGVTLTSFQDTDSDSGSLLTLLETGTYQFIVQGEPSYGNATGAYNFQLIDATAAPSITLDAAFNGTLSPGAESDFYRFTTTTPNQRISFDYLSGSGSNAFWVLWNKNSSYQTYNNLQTEQTFIAQTPGEYFLQIQGNGTSPLTYSASLVTSEAITSPLAFDADTSGTISKLGEQDIYTFNATAGTRVQFDALANNGNNLYWSLISPSGVDTGGRFDTDIDSGTFTLFEDGAYQLVVQGLPQFGNAIGDYRFQLLNASASPLIAPSASVISGSLSPGGSSAYYRINGTAGQRLNFDSQSAAAGALWFFNDNLINSADFDVVLPSSGEYLLELDGNNISPISYSLVLTDTSDPPPASPTPQLSCLHCLL